MCASYISTSPVSDECGITIRRERWRERRRERRRESGGGSGGAADRARLLLFVDDTLAEHLEEEMRSAPNVVRFLFTRARRTQVADAVHP